MNTPKVGDRIIVTAETMLYTGEVGTIVEVIEDMAIYRVQLDSIPDAEIWYSELQFRVLLKAEDFERAVKGSTKLTVDDVLVIPAGTYFEYPIHGGGKKSYTFSETVRVCIRNIDYGQFSTVIVDEQDNFIGFFDIEWNKYESSGWLPLWSLLTGDDPRYIIPDWSKFKVTK